MVSTIMNWIKQICEKVKQKYKINFVKVNEPKNANNYNLNPKADVSAHIHVNDLKVLRIICYVCMYIYFDFDVPRTHLITLVTLFVIILKFFLLSVFISIFNGAPCIQYKYNHEFLNKLWDKFLQWFAKKTL